MAQERINIKKEKPIGKGMTTPTKLRIELESSLQYEKCKNFTKGQLDAVTELTIKIIKSAQLMERNTKEK